MNNLKIQGIAGTGEQGKREKSDFYPTPPEATEALFKMETFEGEVWEPASGDGSMSKIIQKYNKCISSDIRTDDDVYGNRGVDFLERSLSFSFKNNMIMAGETENIITNPPFKFALEFVEESKKIAKKKIAMLLKLNFLESVSRYGMFKDTEFPLSAVYVFSKRLNFYPSTLEKTAKSGVLAYAWYVWDKRHIGGPKIDWILL